MVKKYKATPPTKHTITYTRRIPPVTDIARQIIKKAAHKHTIVSKSAAPIFNTVRNALKKS